jgi:hypothetical protein
MKHEIFISYSDFDKNKVSLIVKELKGNTTFSPIVIAANREALKPLVQKVSDGIIRAKIFLPILTKQSISAQWINQEIGYANALNKRIIPIVDEEIINDLKGFIHKQFDLPYIFTSNVIKSQENKIFVKKLRDLITDLEIEFKDGSSEEAKIKKSDFEIGIEKAEMIKEERKLNRQKIEFLDSLAGVEAAKSEVFNIHIEIEEKIKVLRKKNFHIRLEKEVNQSMIIVINSMGFSFSIAWQQKFSNSTEGSLLFVRTWNGSLNNIKNSRGAPSDESNKLVSDTLFTFDRNINNKNYWKNPEDVKEYNSSQIVDNCFIWLLARIADSDVD